MSKKKLKKQIKLLRHDVDFLTKQIAYLYEDIAKHQCHCENYKPKTVTFKRYVTPQYICDRHEEFNNKVKE